MIQLFRGFFKSKIGIGVTIAFLGLIALAFGLGDVATTGSFGGISGDDRVAIVGDEKISTADLRTALNSDLQAARQQSPTVTMESLLASGGMDDTLNRLVDRFALAEFGRRHGLRAGKRLVDSELRDIPSFRGANGEFDPETYRAVLAQQGLSDKILRDDISAGLLAQQVLLPTALRGTMPVSLAKRYAALQRARRTGEIALLPSAAYMPKDDPSDAALNAYYTENRTDYLRPERRVVRYATFGQEALKNIAPPTDGEIQARFQRDAALYAASETRSLSQLVVPTQAAAQEIIDAVGRGQSFDAAAREKGLAIAQIGPMDKAALTSQASAAVANAAFAAQRGAMAAPARGQLGIYVIRVDAIQSTPARTLAKVRSEITAALTTEKRAAALADLTAEIEDQFDDGSSLAEVAEELDLTIVSTDPLTADGGVYGKPGQQAPAVLARALSTAFAMDEGEPQLAEIIPGQTFLVYDVSQITASAAAPLDEIKQTVTAAWRRSEGAKAAKEAASRVLERIEKGSSVDAAMKEEGIVLPPIDKIDMTREQLAVFQGRVPSVLALMFSMAEGTVKRLEAPSENGWFVVQLADIETGTVADDDPTVTIARSQLGQSVSNEYSAQLLQAIKDEVGVERNQTAIDAVEDQLLGRNQ